MYRPLLIALLLALAPPEPAAETAAEKGLALFTESDARDRG